MLPNNIANIAERAAKHFRDPLPIVLNGPGRSSANKVLPIGLDGPIIFIVDAAAEFEWAHNFFGSFQCLAALVRSPVKISGSAPAILVWFPPPTRNSPGRGGPGPPGPPPPGFPPGFPPPPRGPPPLPGGPPPPPHWTLPLPELARGRGVKLNAACIAVAISVDIICGGFALIGEFFNWFGMSKALSALLSICAESEDCCDFGDTGCSGDGILIVGSSAADSRSSHSFGHGRSGLLAALRH